MDTQILHTSTNSFLFQKLPPKIISKLFCIHTYVLTPAWMSGGSGITIYVKIILNSR